MLDLLDVSRMLREQCRAAGGQQAWAEAHGVSPQYVCDVLNGRREPGDKILSALGLVRVVRYAKRRIAQEEERAGSKPAALKADAKGMGAL